MSACQVAGHICLPTHLPLTSSRWLLSNQLLQDIDAPRTPVYARSDGQMFAHDTTTFIVRRGKFLCKVAGTEPLPWRTGDLLTL